MMRHHLLSQKSDLFEIPGKIHSERILKTEIGKHPDSTHEFAEVENINSYAAVP
jgi:hypothetical protein